MSSIAKANKNKLKVVPEVVTSRTLLFSNSGYDAAYVTPTFLQFLKVFHEIDLPEEQRCMILVRKGIV